MGGGTGKIDEGEREVQGSRYGMKTSRGWKAQRREYSQWYHSSLVWWQTVAAAGECTIMYRLAELLCCTPDTTVTLCVNYTQIKEKIAFNTY